jgi:hypothetical protein
MIFPMAAGKPSMGTSIVIMVNLLQIAWIACYFTFAYIHMPLATSKMASDVSISTANL